MNRKIFAEADFRAHTGHQQSQEVQVLSTRAYWKPWFNKATLFPLKWLLRERLSNRDRIPANIKDLLGSWKVCNENLAELHQSEKSIRPVSAHYPIKLRCVRVHCGQVIVILCLCLCCLRNICSFFSLFWFMHVFVLIKLRQNYLRNVMCYAIPFVSGSVIASSSDCHSALNTPSRCVCPMIKGVCCIYGHKKKFHLLVTHTNSKSANRMAAKWPFEWGRNEIKVTVGGRRAGLSVLQTAHLLSQHHQLSLVMSNDYILSINLSCPAILSPFLFSEKAKYESRDKPTTLKQEHVTTVLHGEDQNLLGMQITAVIIRKVSGETQISRKWELICTCHRSDNQGAISVSGASTSRSLSSPQWHGDPVEREGQSKRRFGALSNKWLNTTL